MYFTWCYIMEILPSGTAMWLQNPRMEQPLADVYFLVVMEHMLDDLMSDARLETALKLISSINEVCLKWE